MSTNEAYLTRCTKCGQYLFEEDSKKCYGCGYEMPTKDYYEEWVNDDAPWYRDAFADTC